MGDKKNSYNMLDAVANLKEAGFEQLQAEALVRTQYNYMEPYLSIKRDIAEVKQDIEKLRQELRGILRK